MDLMAFFDEKIAEFQEAKNQYVTNLEARYQQGYVDGKASVVLPDPNSGELLFTQADMDQVAATAKAEKDNEYAPQIAALNERISALESQPTVDADKVAADAIAAFKAELKAKYAEQQVAESQGETGFATLLD